MTDPILLSRRGKVAELRLNRPARLNALDFPMIERLAACLAEVSVDEEVRALIVCGAGEAFCSGGDLRWAAKQPGGPLAALYLLACRLHGVARAIRGVAKPVIAAIRGPAVGAGFSLALACDLRILGRSAVLRQGYTSNGLCLVGGGTYTLPRLVGQARALEIVAMDRPIDAERALAWGLATEVVDDGDVIEAAFELGQRLAARSVHAYARTKRLIVGAWNGRYEERLEREREGIEACLAHPDGREGIQAFLEGRRPVYPPGA